MTKKTLFLSWTLVLSLAGAYLAARFLMLYQGGEGDFLKRINWAGANLGSDLVGRPGAIPTQASVWWGAGAVFGAIWLGYLYHFAFPKNYLPGSEHGSARWGTKSDIVPFINPDPDQNIILSATERLSLGEAKDFKYERNHNVLVIGGSGSGKTYSQVKPNLMQLNSSFVVTDPKGTILPDVGYLFEENGYALKTFNSVDFKKSLHYNPFAYIKSEKDILKLANVLIVNTKGEGRIGDDFWVKAEKLWLAAAIGYLYYETPPADHNLPALLDLLDVTGASENDESYRCPLDVMFEDLAAKKPTCFPVRQYHKFKLAAGNTAKSILISVAARLSPFDIAELREVLADDELDLESLGQKKTALFVIMSDTDNTYAFLAAMLFYQLFDLLTLQADANDDGILAVPVRFLLDEFANIGCIPNFEKTIATIRSRGISAQLMVQSLAQLTAIYQKKAAVIVDCCDTTLFLGGKSIQTTKEIAQMIGTTTVDHQSTGETKGQSGSYNLNQQILGRSLIDPAEIAKMSRDECLVLISGLPPFKSKKYDPRRHPRFHFLADSGHRLKYRVGIATMSAGVMTATNPLWGVGKILNVGVAPVLN